MRKNTSGFTIVELIVIIAVIGVLAMIGFVSFSSVQAGARDLLRSSDVTIISEALEKYYDQNGDYPSCAAITVQPATVTTDTLKGMDPKVLTAPNVADGTNSVICSDITTSSSSSVFGYVVDGDGNWELKYKEESSGAVVTITNRRPGTAKRILTIASGANGTVNAGGTYNLGSSQTITATPNIGYVFSGWAGSAGCAGTASHSITMDANKSCTASFAFDSANWVAVGSQVWSKYNLNVGTMITSTLDQANNSVLEKYCYNNTESNCTTYGGLYQWGEAVQYLNGASNRTSPSPSFSGNVQGMCPTGAHIPTDNEWKILEMQLGMTQAQADAMTSWRGTDQGTQLKSGGTSGLNIPIAGYNNTSGSFFGLSLYTMFWSSSEYDYTGAPNPGVSWHRSLYAEYAGVYRSGVDKEYGYSLRCLLN